MKKKYKDSDFYLCGDDVNSESPKTIEVTCKLMAQGGLSVADGCRCLTKELDMIAC